MKNILKGSGWFLVASVTCPCHLVLLLPLFAGTGIGLYFEEYRTAIFTLFILLFVISLYMGGRKFFSEPKRDEEKQDCCSIERFKI